MKLRRILAGTATAMLIGAGSVVATVPAQASQSSYQVCNSTASVGYIEVWSYGGYFSSHYLDRGQCSNPGSVSTIRVDVDPGYNYGVYPDVDSYYIGVIGQGYGPCHDSENHASDPPNDAPNGVRYNTNQSHC